jgi:hypothetical protein
MFTRTRMPRKAQREERENRSLEFTNAVKRAQRRALDHGNRALDLEEKRIHDTNLTTTELKERAAELSKPRELMSPTKTVARNLQEKHLRFRVSVILLEIEMWTQTPRTDLRTKSFKSRMTTKPSTTMGTMADPFRSFLMLLKAPRLGVPGQLLNVLAASKIRH